ncbi:MULTISPECIES: DUF1292 domain-containing protein [Mesotoga]|jgi:hypothetical protein|uniref:DUF1292 domain-containing protein n=1 Tax=Mesotoga TaxID=1184396 RepID=UPI002C73D16B|nr:MULTISPECIES: DUF1292 domain-containing protein [Mesotoga]HOZ99828.1 DUF1292 domain-containing protein [Mesotoga prima]HRX65661.1 DUF1292 domain-containing protein [Mesotoga sp.]HUM22595.1 DUF1292 domain-containing protein [Mesotoga prima]
MMEEKKELEFHVSEECNDPNCDHDHDLVSDVDRFTVTDEDGSEHHFTVIAEFENNDNTYWVVEEFFEEDDEEADEEEDDASEDEEEEGYIVFRVEYDENENPYLYSVEDEEFEEVSKAWNKLVEEMIAEDDEEE